jgi:hypothetical protein
MHVTNDPGKIRCTNYYMHCPQVSWQNVPVANIIKLLGIIYAASGAFPYDFDWVNADSGVIMSKKFYNSCHSFLCKGCKLCT